MGDSRRPKDGFWSTRHARRRKAATVETGDAAARKQADARTVDEGRCGRREGQMRARDLSG
jgi:hypothetical protein